MLIPDLGMGSGYENSRSMGIQVFGRYSEFRGLGIHADPADSSLTPQKDWSKSTPMKNNILRHSSPKYCPTHEKGPESPRFPATLNNWASIVFSVLQPRLLEVVWVCVCVSIHGDWTGDPHRVKLLSEKRKKKKKKKASVICRLPFKKVKTRKKKESQWLHWTQRRNLLDRSYSVRGDRSSYHFGRRPTIIVFFGPLSFSYSLFLSFSLEGKAEQKTILLLSLGPTLFAHNSFSTNNDLGIRSLIWMINNTYSLQEFFRHLISI